MAFTNYFIVTIDHTQCGSGDSTDFPVGISITNASLKTVGNGGKVQNANGFDIRPFSNQGLTSALTFELVFYDAATGQLEMYVKIPTLSASSDVVFYLAFGDSSISTDGSSTSTWNSNFKAVYHLKDGSTLTLTDSTSNGNTLTNNNSAAATAGLIDGGVLLDKNVLPTPPFLSIASAFVSGVPITFEAWINIPVLGTSDVVVMSGATSAERFSLRTSAGGGGQLVATSTAGAASSSAVKTGLSITTWTHAVAVFAASNSRVAYLNGVAGTAETTTRNVGTITQGGVGGDATTTVFFGDGTYDEVRISNVARSADWLLSTYNNLKPSSTFLGFSALQSINNFRRNALLNGLGASGPFFNNPLG